MAVHFIHRPVKWELPRRCYIPDVDTPNLFSLHLRTLFTFDALGRMTGTNEPRPGPAPRIYTGNDGRHTHVRVRHDIPEAVSREWLACSPEALRDVVARHATIANEHRGPAFLLPPLEPGIEAVPVRAGHLLHPELVARGWRIDETAPYLGVIREGQVVAVCFSARSTPEADAAGVETAESYRRRGLALEAVRGWAAAVQAGGRHAFYSTTWENEASQRVAAALGAFQIGEDWSLG